MYYLKRHLKTYYHLISLSFLRISRDKSALQTLNAVHASTGSNLAAAKETTYKPYSFINAIHFNFSCFREKNKNGLLENIFMFNIYL